MTAPEIPPQPRPTALRPRIRSNVNWRHLTMWLALMVLFALFVRSVQPILMPFVLGMTIAYLMDPLANRLVRLGMGRHIASAILTVGLFSLVAAIITWLGPLLYQQLVELLLKAPSLLKQIAQAAQHDAAPLLKTLHALAGPEGDESIPGSVNEVVQNAFASVARVATGLFESAATMLNLFALLLITPIVCFYLIRDWTGVLTRADALLPRAYAPTIREQLRLINKTLAAYVRGQLTVIVILILYYTLAFVIVDVHYALLLALVAGLLVIIPYIGTLLSIGLGLAIAYSQFGLEGNWWAMLGIYTAGNILESQILTPKVIGDRVGLHPLWMMFGMLCGAVLLGFVGVLLAVPLTAVISVLVKFAIQRYLDSGLYTEQ